MELYGQDLEKNVSQPESAPASLETGLEESMQGMSLQGREASPKLQHKVEGAVQSGVGKYPDRVRECQYYIRTGTCKFGVKCKFNHSRNDSGTFKSLNVFGYPLRPEEKKCSYYLKTGRCKYGRECKLHHPQPVGVSSPAAACPFYPTMQNLSSSSAEQHGGSTASYRDAMPPALHGSYVPGAYSPMLYPPLVFPFTNWSTYPGPLTPGAQEAAGVASSYGMSHLTTCAPLPGTYPPYISYSDPSSSIQKEQPLPVRIGKPECQFYMKTGYCKFGPSCWYHHPPAGLESKINCLLSPEGLPLRPGVQPCTFYMRNGHCKVGRACRFDHPM